MTNTKAYTREFCEAEYDTRRTAPDADEVMARRQALCAGVSEELNAQMNIAYGPQAKQKLDVFEACGVSRGVLIYFHGGYWQRMDKKDVVFLARPFVKAGYSFVNVNYTLAPQATLDEIVIEAQAACAWTWDHIADWSGERSNIHVCGSSAGGHLAMMMASTDWPQVQAHLPADLIKGACGISGLYELEPLLLTSINDAVGLDAASATRNSPALLQPRVDGPVVLAVGSLESNEFHRQTQQLASAWAGRVGAIDILNVQGRHHFDIQMDFTNPSSTLARTVLGRMASTAPRP